jgi:hypothetical protein
MPPFNTMELTDDSVMIQYTQGVGPSARVYKEVNRFDNGWIQLIGFDRNTWILPSSDLELIKELDTLEFSKDPELNPSSGRPVDYDDRRIAVFQREHYHCQNCANQLSKERSHTGVTRYAIHPDQGGSRALTNLYACCHQCHGRAIGP